jgi:hypothetical protein
MRIAVLCHACYKPSRVRSQYLVGLLANLWRKEGHEVKFLSGVDCFWPADVALLHVDLSVVPGIYLDFARRYPFVINRRVLDIRKSTVSRNLVGPDSGYEGRVIVKTDLNAGGYPEKIFRDPPPPKPPLVRRAWRKGKRVLWPQKYASSFNKPYRVYDSIRHIPVEVLGRPGRVVEKFRPEEEDGLFFIRRCNVLGDRAVSHRMGYRDPIGEGVAPLFEWLENSPQVLDKAKDFGLDFGAVDYTVHDGHAVIIDINKTVGLGSMENEVVRKNWDEIARRLAPGIGDFVLGSQTKDP